MKNILIILTIFLLYFIIILVKKYRLKMLILQIFNKYLIILFLFNFLLYKEGCDRIRNTVYDTLFYINNKYNLNLIIYFKHLN